MNKTDQIVERPAPAIGDELASYMSAKFKDEIEIIEGEPTDVATPAVIRTLSVDMLRELETWEEAKQLASTRNYNVQKKADHMLSSELFRLAIAVSCFAVSRECSERSACRMTDAFISLEDLEKDFPEATERIKDVVGKILSTSYEVMKDNALNEHSRQNKTMRPLAQAAKNKTAAADRARDIAAEKWKADVAQKIRIGEMADIVYRAMVDEGFKNSLPDTVDSLRKWIKVAAPGYARKGGKPRKPI